MGVLSKVNEASDPIQNLFLSKLNEYREKATGLGFGELVESNSAIEELRAFEMGNLTKKYGKKDRKGKTQKNGKSGSTKKKCNKANLNCNRNGKKRKREKKKCKKGSLNCNR